MAGVDGIKVNHGPIFSHTTLALQAAIHGQGVALGHSFLAQPELAAGRLVCPFPEVLVSRNSYYLVTLQSQADSGKIAAFTEWVKSIVQQEQEALKEITGAEDVD